MYAIGNFPKYLNELRLHESDALLKQLRELIVNNHDLQVRFKWRNVNDIGERAPFLWLPAWPFLFAFSGVKNPERPRRDVFAWITVRWRWEMRSDRQRLMRNVC